jgi:hypothetical protein
MKEYEFVVARYNENIDWLDRVKDNCIIYNKGVPLEINNEIPLKNVGRESHTYLWHIIHNYDNLAEVTIFTQGCISDSKTMPNRNTLENLLRMKCEAENEGKSIFLNINKPISYEHRWSNPDFNIKDGKWVLENNYNNNNKILFKDWFIQHTKETEFPDPLIWYGNGIFAIRKDIILKNPKDYYESLIKEVEHHINPIEGHFFERSWYYIFS